MKVLGRLVVTAALIEVCCWVLATALRPGSWRYNISDLYAAGAPRPVVVMMGEAVFALGLALLALGLHQALPRTDHRVVGCALLMMGSLGAMLGALARNSCEESVPRCQGSTFTTTADWLHGVGGLLEILGVAGAAIVLAAVLPRHWSTYSAVTAGAVLALVLGWATVPYPWVGTAERVLALALVAWVIVMGRTLVTGRPALHSSADART